MSIKTPEVAVAAFPEPAMGRQPIASPKQSLLLRLNYGARLWFFKIFVTVALGAMRIIKAREVRNVRPTYTKRYAPRPQLENRVFLPPNFNPSAKLPLLIDIHGGGFALCDPQTDDQFCHHFANTYNFCVVSINYRKAPSYAFPLPVEDAAELARAVLADKNLPVDWSKVALGGFSAGGNLALAIAQRPGIKEKVKAVVPVYPVVDFTGKYKGAYRTNKEGKEDGLKKTAALFNWGYVSPGQDLSDPQLSPIYASRQDLPDQIFFVGAQYDYLCHEAEVMAKMLAGVDEHADLGTEWNKKGIRWKEVPDQRHGFTHVPLSGEREIKRKRVCDELYAEMAQWLTQEAFT